MVNRHLDMFPVQELQPEWRQVVNAIVDGLLEQVKTKHTQRTLSSSLVLVVKRLVLRALLHAFEWAAQLPRPLMYAAEHGRLRPQQHRPALLDDARLLHGYLLESVAQDGHVVPPYGADDTQLRQQDVGGVQPAAQTRLDDGPLHLLGREMREGHLGADLEERHIERGLLGLAEDVLCQSHHLSLRDHLPVDSDPLSEGAHVGRGEEADTVAGQLQGTGKLDGCGALAVGAGDVHGLEAHLGVAHECGEFAAVDHAHLDGVSRKEPPQTG
mmetsp:Transcript_12142/g.35153  ORF Transcript_12142/g.35153 Transcript_12142/m.35153 type:complete len:270 (-) Transcript_12142:104-913(-)